MEDSITCAVQVYQNDLFTDGDVLGGPSGGRGDGSYGQGQTGAMRPGSSRMQQQKNSLAARRQERMQANVYEPSDMTNRNVPSSPAGPMSRLALAGGETSQPASNQDDVYGLKSSYDPNEENGVARTFVKPRQQQPPPQNRQHMLEREQQQQQQHEVPRAPRLDLTDLKGFLAQPAPKGGPVLCYIVRDASSTKMFPKYNLFLEDGKRSVPAA